jgi:hypothetical protein
MMKEKGRLVGEIAFQMDRRILEYIFSGYATDKYPKKRYYGFSIGNIEAMIQKEAVLLDGSRDHRRELEMRKRFQHVVKTLGKLGYHLDKHGQFSQDLVNKYGLLRNPPSRKMAKKLGLNDPMVLRGVFCQFIHDKNEMYNVLLLLDCLCWLAYEDGRPLLFW